MAKINLLPWRDELREQRKREFQFVSVGVVILGVLVVIAMYMFFSHKLSEQEQANQAVVTENQKMDAQLKSLDGLQGRRNAIVDRMKLIQGLQAQRPVTVRLLDELARSIPNNLYITSFVRVGNQFTIIGRAESPNTVAELLRNLEVSSWFRNVFMRSYQAGAESTPQGSVLPRIESGYGSFEITADLGEIATDIIADPAIPLSGSLDSTVMPSIGSVDGGASVPVNSSNVMEPAPAEVASLVETEGKGVVP